MNSPRSSGICVIRKSRKFTCLITSLFPSPDIMAWASCWPTTLFLAFVIAKIKGGSSHKTSTLNYT